MPCASCGLPIEQGQIGRPRKFCSDKCKRRAGNARRRRRLLPLRAANTVERICAECGDEFAPRNRNRIYCYGKFCAQTAYRRRKREDQPPRIGPRLVSCDGCGVEFAASDPSARWCSKTCANRHWGLVRARQRVRPAADPYTDRDIFERDCWTCALCSHPIDPTLPRLHEMGATIDHIVPLSIGGADDETNVQAAHWSCNRAKGAKVSA